MTSCACSSEEPKVAPATFSDPLFERIKAFNFDFMGGPYPFSKRLANENDWPYEHTLMILDELRKLLYLVAKFGPDLVAPPDVEDAWRLALIYTGLYYRRLCDGTLGVRIEHECDNGTKSPAEMSRRWRKTIDAYRKTFGEPNEHIWFEPEWHGLNLKHRLIHRARSIVSSREVLIPRFEIRNVPAEYRDICDRIRNFKFDPPGANYPFLYRLADESFESDLRRGALSAAEYLKFLCLMAMKRHSVTPCLDVDEAWHLHMGNSVSYWSDMMDKTIGHPFHHSPGNGEEESENLFKAVYQRTLEEYDEHFGTPPVEFWGARDLTLDWRKALEGTAL